MEMEVLFNFHRFLCVCVCVCVYTHIFLGPHVQHMEVPRPEFKLLLQLPAYTTATAMQDPSCICDYTTAHGNTGSLTH